MLEVILRTAIGQPRNRWKARGGDMHFGQPAGGKPTMRFDRICELLAPSILDKKPAKFRPWFIDNAVKGETWDRQIWQDLLIDCLFDLRFSCLASLRDYRGAARSDTIKPIHTRLPTLQQELDKIRLVLFRVKLFPRPKGGMLRCSRLETTQNVFRDLLGVRLPLGYTSGPVGGGCCKHDAVVGIDPHRSCALARKILRILNPFRTKPRGREDNKVLRRTIVMARNRKTAFVRAVGNRCAVAFVPDQGVIRSEDVTVLQTGTFENPVIGMLHLIANGFAPAPPLPAAITVADAGQAVFWVNPEPLVPLLVIAGEPALVANKSGVALHKVDPPPADIAAEEGDISALFYKHLNSAPHRLAPVFVVTGAEEESIGSQKVSKVSVYIEIGAVIDCEAVAFEPTDETSIPMPEGLPRR